MKPALTGLVMLLLFTTLSAQSIRTPLSPVIPNAVMDQFSLLYPDASGVVWTEQNDKYMADFKNGKMHTAAMFYEDGAVLQTETEIRVIALPPDATSFLVDDLGVKKIEVASIIEDAPGVITFKARADAEEYRFDGNGRPLGAHAYGGDAPHE